VDVRADSSLCHARHLPLSHCAVKRQTAHLAPGAPIKTLSNKREAMDRHSVLSKTGKGLLQLKYKSHPMPDDQFRVLGLVDGRTMLSHLAASSRMNDASLHNALVALAEGGYIREVAAPVATPDSHSANVAPALESENDLDFTRSLKAARKAPKGDV